MLDAFQIRLPIVNFVYNLIEQLIQLVLDVFVLLRLFIVLFLRINQFFTIGFVNDCTFLSILSLACYLIFCSSNLTSSSPGSWAPLGKIPAFWTNLSWSFLTKLARSTPRFAGISLALLL